MKQKILGIPTWLFLAFAGVCVIGILVGSFVDLSFSKAVASTSNGLGAFVETFGETLAFAPFGMAAAMVFLAFRKKEATWMKVLAWAALIIVIGVGTYFLGDFVYGKTGAPDKDGTLFFGLRVESKILAFGYGFVITAIFAAITFFIVDQNKEEELLRVGLALLAAMALQWLLLHFLKRIGGRPRFRFLYLIGADSGVWEGAHYDFLNWWQFTWYKNPGNDYFKSWPSGHSATAGVALLFGLLPHVLKKNFKYDTYILFGCGALYGFFVAFSRILAGAHYLSDVSMGLLIGCLVSYVSALLADKLFRKKQEETPEPAIQE